MSQLLLYSPIAKLFDSTPPALPVSMFVVVSCCAVALTQFFPRPNSGRDEFFRWMRREIGNNQKNVYEMKNSHALKANRGDKKLKLNLSRKIICKCRQRTGGFAFTYSRKKALHIIHEQSFRSPSPIIKTR